MVWRSEGFTHLSNNMKGRESQRISVLALDCSCLREQNALHCHQNFGRQKHSHEDREWRLPEGNVGIRTDSVLKQHSPGSDPQREDRLGRAEVTSKNNQIDFLLPPFFQ